MQCFSRKSHTGDRTAQAQTHTHTRARSYTTLEFRVSTNRWAFHYVRSSFNSTKLSPVMYNIRVQYVYVFVCTGIGTVLLYSIKLYYSGTSDKINAYSTRSAFVFAFFFVRLLARFACWTVAVAATNLTHVCMWYFSMCFISNKLYHASLVCVCKVKYPIQFKS